MKKIFYDKKEYFCPGNGYLLDLVSKKPVLQRNTEGKYVPISSIDKTPYGKKTDYKPSYTSGGSSSGNTNPSS